MNPTTRTSFISFIERRGDSIPISSHQDCDLSAGQKRDRLAQWLDNDPIYFFSLVRPHLPPELITLWNQQELPATTPITANSKESSLTPSQQHSIIRNRRYHYLTQHLRHSDYFSEDTLQLRVPSLYEEYIGQYIPDSERYAPFRNEVSLVDRIYNGMDRHYVQDQWQRKQRSEEEQFEEQEDDEDDDEDEDQQQTTTLGTPSPLRERPMNHLIDLRQEKKEELVRLLEEQWIDGMDDQFDYSIVDNNDTFDDFVQQNQDMQDRYFDDELEEENGPNHDTGVLDY
ncbi:coiled-coil domain-containing protein-domain-containing protein, partial [Absidia repens]